MIGKLIAVVTTFSLLFFSLGFLYQNLPQTPVEMAVNTTETGPTQIIDYGATPVFSENLRFNHDNISYSIESSCSKIRSEAMQEAFQILEEKINIIHFRETGNGRADISVGCSDDFVEFSKGLFAAGEGGPSEIINTSYFRVIQKGKVLLYKDPRCNRPVVELHELLHVFGFDHSPDPKSIMYNVSSCDQKIGQDIIDLIKKLYSIEPLPDARISELSASKKGKYLDFNITVLNEGLMEIGDINLTLVIEGKKIDSISLGEIGIGYGRTLRVTNMRLPSRNIENIDFIIDRESAVKELNEDNNLIQMVVTAS